MTQDTNVLDGQPASQAVADATPQQGAQREDGSWIPYSSYPQEYREEGTPQWQHVAHDGKEYRRLQKEGWGSLSENAKAAGLSAHQLNQLLTSSPDVVKSLLDGGSVPAGQPQYSQQPAPQQQQVDPYQAYMQQYYGQQPAQQPPPGLTLDQLGQWWTKQEAALDKKFSEKLSAKDKEFESRDKMLGATLEYEDAMKGAVKDILGRDLKPSKTQFLGQTRELDFDAENAKMLVDQWAARAYNEQIPLGPEGDAMRRMPTPARYVKEAAAALKPMLAAKDRSAMESLAAQQAQLPNGTVPAGPAGRPQLNTGEMNPDQRAEEAMRRYHARRAAPSR